jgi:DNA-binding transcriptional MerR regulator
VRELAIKDVAERTGIAAGTIRMWEQRYGFPVPGRTPAGYRRYTLRDVDLLRRVASLRESGLSVPAAIQRAQASEPIDQPSLFGAVVAMGAPVTSQLLRKRTLTSISRAMEDEVLARGTSPILVGAFKKSATTAWCSTATGAWRRWRTSRSCSPTSPTSGKRPTSPRRSPSPEDAIGNEWAVVIDAPGYAACLLAWEHPRSEAEDAHLADGDRRFESCGRWIPRWCAGRCTPPRPLPGRSRPEWKHVSRGCCAIGRSRRTPRRRRSPPSATG